MDVHAAVEQRVTVDGHVMGHTDEANMSAGTRGVDRLHHGLLRADCLDRAVRTETVCQLFDLLGPLFAALLDDVSRAELAGQSPPVSMPTGSDDSVGPELLGGHYPQQANGTVTNDSDGLARTGFGGNRCEPSRSQHIRGCHQR